MQDKKNTSDTLLYILTFVAAIVLVTCFATHLVIGNTDLIEMDSLAGGTLIGFILFFYFGWFVSDSKISNKLSLMDAVRLNLKHNPAVLAMYFYWLVFVLVPVLCKTS